MQEKNMKWFAIPACIVLVVSVVVFAQQQIGNEITIRNGTITTLPDIELEVYGAAVGTVRIKLGDYRWTPDELWLVPEGTSIEHYRSASQQSELPSYLNVTNNCKTSLYHNATTEKYAYKILSLGANGSFCILASAGTYDLYAKY
ncbi:MAG: hypothetical protein HY832_02920 [Candidatus Aenigmarchaeota archaeon]|nr:hypothetical protein [Candidatus Aenigmarchaeota archaeon]